MQAEIAIDPSLWSAFRERLRRYIAGRVSPASREDVVGDIMLKLVQHRDQLAVTRDPFAWITRVAANAVADHHRRRASEQRAMAAFASEASLLDETVEAASSTPSAADSLAACVLPFIECLPPAYRDALKLVEIDGLSQKAAAARLGLSVSGMKSRIQRARRQLKDAILRCCAVELDRRGGVMAYEKRPGKREKLCCAHDTCR